MLVGLLCEAGELAEVISRGCASEKGSLGQDGLTRTVRVQAPPSTSRRRACGIPIESPSLNAHWGLRGREVHVGSRGVHVLVPWGVGGGCGGCGGCDSGSGAGLSLGVPWAIELCVTFPLGHACLSALCSCEFCLTERHARRMETWDTSGQRVSLYRLVCVCVLMCVVLCLYPSCVWVSYICVWVCSSLSPGVCVSPYVCACVC